MEILLYKYIKKKKKKKIQLRKNMISLEHLIKVTWLSYFYGSEIYENEKMDA